jgi:Domain of unknown function (DUF5666)
MMLRVLLRTVLLVPLVLAAWPQAARAQNPSDGQEKGPPGEGGQQRRMFRGDGVFGRIQSISPTEMKLEARDGSTVTVRITSKTQFRIDQQAAKIENFKAGTPVLVRGTKTGDGTWEADVVATRGGPSPMMQGMGKDFVLGTVKSIDGTKITILRLDGATQTVEADENTSLLKHRESITLADIHVGDGIAVRGETKDGAFVPRTVNVLDPAQLERMKQFLGSGGAPGSSPPQGEKKPGPDSKPPQGLR